MLLSISAHLPSLLFTSSCDVMFYNILGFYIKVVNRLAAFLCGFLK